jgi:regulatory protein
MAKRDPIELAAQSLRRRDHTRQEIDDRLGKAGVDAAARAEAIETLERVGYLDDARFARTRAELLATRGLGDAGIRFDLEAHGVDAGLAGEAVAGLAPEAERAAALVAGLGRTPKTAARLARKGFSAESLESALGEIASDTR